MDREEFIQACREGGSRFDRVFRSVYDSLGQALLREAWFALRDTDAAQDLLQDTLNKVWTNCRQFRGDSELLAWCKAILRRTAIDRLRQRHPEVPIDDEFGNVLPEAECALLEQRESASHQPEATLEGEQVDSVYRRCAIRFAAEHPEAAEMIRWIVEDGLKPADIAKLIQRSPGATREYISQCRKKARHYYSDWYALVGQRPVASGSRGGQGFGEL